MRAQANGNGHIRGTDIMHKAVDPLHLAQSNPVGGIDCGIPFVFRASLDATTTSVSFNIPPGLKLQVIDAWGVMTGAGAGSDTYKVTDGTDDIVTAVDVSAAGDKDIVRAAEIDDSKSTVDGGTLVVANASGALVDVYVMCLRIR